MRRLIIAVMLLFINLSLFSQNTYTISGKVKEASSGEDMIGVSIYFKDKYVGTETNFYGFYSLTYEEGKYTIVFSYVGYKEQIVEIDLKKDTIVNIKMEESSEELEEVVISEKSAIRNLSNAEMSVTTMSVKEIEMVPVLFGEKDIMKTIQLMPGISTISEGSSNFSVRGGSFDQNLIQLDESNVYNAAHVLGFFSSFNSDIVKNIRVYKGGIPPRYGGRASSVIDISMKDGNNKKFSGAGGIGLISSKLTLEGPILEDKASFVISARRTYLDYLANLFNLVPDSINFSLYFYDLNAKINYNINESNKVFVSVYSGRDNLSFNTLGSNFGNLTGTVRWNWVINNQSFSNLSLIYSKYDFGFNVGVNTFSYSSYIIDYGIKNDFNLYISKNNTIEVGYSVINHKFNPGKLIASGSSLLTKEKQYSYESGAYVFNKHNITDKLNINYGFRISMFNLIGPHTQKTYDATGEVISNKSITFKSGEVAKTYYNLEPRLSGSYLMSESNSLKFSYNRMAQYLHVLTNSSSGQPTDTWIMSSNNIKPVTIDQVALGFFQNFIDDQYEFSVETYYKQMTDITDFIDGANVFTNRDYETQILQGTGRSYGLELLLKKQQGNFSGWISYTLSKSERKIEGINNNQWYNSIIDRTHDVSVVLNYKLASKWTISSTFVYATGLAVSFPVAKYQIDGIQLPLYTSRNGYRMPSSHRLDLNLHYEMSNWGIFDFSIYNAYNQWNPYFINFTEDPDTGKTEAVKTSIFGIIPSISWNFKY